MTDMSLLTNAILTERLMIALALFHIADESGEPVDGESAGEWKSAADILGVELASRAQAVESAVVLFGCPHCGGKLNGVWQPALVAGRAGTVLLSCPVDLLTYDVRDLGGLSLGGDLRDENRQRLTTEQREIQALINDPAVHLSVSTEQNARKRLAEIETDLKKDGQ